MEFTKVLAADQEVQPCNISKPGGFEGEDTSETNVNLPPFHRSSISTIFDRQESLVDDVLSTRMLGASEGSFSERQPRKTPKTQALLPMPRRPEGSGKLMETLFVFLNVQ